LSCVALGVLVLSKCLSVLISARAWAYIVVGKTIYAITPYKNMSLKMILYRYNIALNDNDIITHDINKPLNPLQSVKITRIKKRRRKLIICSPFEVTGKRKYNLNLRKIELQKGVEKNIIRIIDEIFHDGVLYSSNIVDEKTVTRKYCRIVLFDSNNTIEEIYDLSKAKRVEMVATAYYPGDPLAWRSGTV